MSRIFDSVRNPLVRAVARVPLPIRAKQLFGSLVVAALLALVAVLGLVALGQSNSRGTELRRLQQQGGYEQLLLTDATQLKLLLDFRLDTAGIPELRPSRSEEPDLLPAFDPASYQRGFLSALDQQIGNEATRLCLDADVNRMSDELQRLYQELETASRHKSDFLATMSHELRTPLNAIIGFSEVLHEQMFGELNERQLADVEDVLEAGNHLLSLINDVLDLAKIEAGGMELELSEVAIPEVLRSAVSLHSERASRGGVELSLTTEPEEIAISADGRRVRQIVFNLVSNAVKFTPAEGRVDVSARLDDGQVEIAVADTGPGIAPEELETIFEEFKQATDGKRAEGTGLGLPLSQKLVELHGGRLWVESEVGRGSTFRLTLPVGPTEPASVLPN